jgi:hypothetical protein
MFSESLHLSGGWESVAAEPFPLGPRHEAQLAESAGFSCAKQAVPTPFQIKADTPAATSHPLFFITDTPHAVIARTCWED